MPVRKDINFNSGFTGCEDRMAILKNSTVPRNLGELEEIEPADINTEMYVYVDEAGKGKKIKLGNVVDESASQVDWDEEDDTSYAYIKNKPIVDLPEDLISLFNVGGVKAGDVFPAGTSIYDLLVRVLSAPHDDVPFYFGVLNEFPLEWSAAFITSALELQDNVDLQESLTNGFSVTFTANNQFYVLAVPKTLGIEVSEVIQDDLKLNFRYIKGIDSA